MPIIDTIFPIMLDAKGMYFQPITTVITNGKNIPLIEEYTRAYFVYNCAEIILI